MKYGDTLWKSIGDIIEVIPADYWPEVYSDKIEYYGDEEGRFNENNHRNPFFKVLKGNPMLGELAEWDVVGDILREELIEEGKV
jgi:hypothetical protein